MHKRLASTLLANPKVIEKVQRGNKPHKVDWPSYNLEPKITWLTDPPITISHHLEYLLDDCLVGIVVKVSALTAEDPGFESCQAPGIKGSALGLVGLVSVYCDWVRWKVWPATSISVWQHVKLLSSSVPEHVAGTLSNHQTTTCMMQGDETNPNQVRAKSHISDENRFACNLAVTSFKSFKYKRCTDVVAEALFACLMS